ncbi:hypothetical protein HME9302_02359 [Alteripontixanthobacter maritimus]|uniref:Pili assembly chaperone N-terminal domain-containing protein n=1 Tax=Alteripontixanthobacter maritimus TaxID=2161824 RepID=A0A369Q9W1_9SPHN|nr:molecular chaperone [Alteripontixanthobacter maritimus]RDC61140.1 hypothetical protein HME9302_02359 [Alteripontixanthobacter maritimus]
MKLMPFRLPQLGKRAFASTIAGAALAASLAAPVPVAAQGDLLVAPTRVILDGRRGTEVILSNIGSEEATYRISLVLRRMNASGTLVEVSPDEANELEEAALSMVRYAPRRIVLPPGQPQAVRIAARPSTDLPDGEYRAHMSFQSIPKAAPLTEQGSNPEGVSLRLIPIYGVTIPIIIRHGEVAATVALANPRVTTDVNGSLFHLDMQRSGESSTYGELRVLKQGSDEPIYMARGVAIYPELDERQIAYPVTAEQAALMSGPVRVEFREMPEKGGALIASVDTVMG